ncbi:MAG TPA: TolC family protein [Deltaproteobacteria bacterium]|nr:TolC family protein [Deltaproteobacteria bacterium]
MKPRFRLFAIVASMILALPGTAASSTVWETFTESPLGGKINNVEEPRVDRLRPRPERISEDLPKPEDGQLSISVEDAVVFALRNNRSLAVQLFSPIIAGTFEEQERAVFDASLFAETSLSREKIERNNLVTGKPVGLRSESETYRAGIGRRLSTGTSVDLSVRQSRSDSGTVLDRQAAGVELSLTQALLRGAGRKVNLAGIRQAELDTMISIHEVRGFTEALVAETETTYWDLLLAERQVLIFREALRIARQQVEDIERRIAVGTVAETELAAAQAELASRRQGLINAHSRREKNRLSLLRLINPGSSDAWLLELEPRDCPKEPDIELDPPGDHVALGLSLRPELAEAELRIEQGDLEVIQTRDGLLPRLDLFITLGKTGYADSFGGSFSDITGPGYRVAGGVSFEWSLKNRAARAAERRALAGRGQAVASLDNMAQLIVEDILGAHVEACRARAQIEASAERRRLQEEVVRSEKVKFDVGRGTSLAVALAQRDLLESRLDEVDAIIGYRKARIALYRLDGSLLMRRGIVVDADLFAGE